MSKGLYILKRLVYLQNKIKWCNNVLRKLGTFRHIGKWKSR